MWNYERTKDNKRQLVHRKVMEENLGRKLESSEIVHHIDGNTLNNSLDNLELTTRSKHAKEHGLKGDYCKIGGVINDTCFKKGHVPWNKK